MLTVRVPTCQLFAKSAMFQRSVIVVSDLIQELAAFRTKSSTFRRNLMQLVLNNPLSYIIHPQTGTKYSTFVSDLVHELVRP